MKNVAITGIGGYLGGRFLNRLEQEGFVASENFRGFYVKPIDLGEIWEAFGLREALETYAVEMAIKSGCDEDIQLLEEKQANHAQYTPPYYTQTKFLLDIEFHTQIASMAKNKIIEFQLKRNFEHIFLRTNLDHYEPQRMVSALEEHQQLLSRIKKKDMIGSVEIIENHIQRARDLVIRCISRDESEEGEYF